MITIHRWPRGLKIAYAIRDDDLCYFTTPSMLEDVYSKAWAMGYKVSFATVPMIYGSNNLNVPPLFRGSSMEYSITGNPPLVSMVNKLISEGRAEVMLHGYHHTDNLGIPKMHFDLDKGTLSSENSSVNLNACSEFFDLGEGQTRNRVQSGKMILNKAFGMPGYTFIPPQEYVSSHLIRIIREEGLFINTGISRRLLVKAPPQSINIMAILKTAAHKARQLPLEIYLPFLMDIPAAQANYRHYWNRFITQESSRAAFEEYKRKLAEQIGIGGYIILLTHLWEYFYDWKSEITMARQYEYLNIFLEQAREISWKCTLSDLTDRMLRWRSVRMTRRGDRIRLQSSLGIRDLWVSTDDGELKNISSGDFGKGVPIDLEPDLPTELRII